MLASWVPIITLPIIQKTNNTRVPNDTPAGPDVNVYKLVINMLQAFEATYLEFPTTTIRLKNALPDVVYGKSPVLNMICSI